MPHRVGILGAGVNGLSAAFRLAEAGHEVDIFCDMLPIDSHVPSQGAGGLWMPFPGGNPSQDLLEAQWAAVSFSEFSNQQQCQGPLGALGKHIEFVTLFRFFTDVAPELPPWAKQAPHQAAVCVMQDVPAAAAARPEDELLQLTMKRLPPGYRAAWMMKTPICHAGPYLIGLLEIVTAYPRVTLHAGSDFHVTSPQQFQQLAEKFKCTVMINAAGLDGSDVAGEQVEFYGAQGTVLQVDRPTSLNECVVVMEGPLCQPDAASYPTYVIPRGPALCTVGGTYFKVPARDVQRIRNDPDALAKIAAEQTEHVLTRVRALVPELRHSKLRSTWTGWRPCRSEGIRLEIEPQPQGGNVPVVHCYGHGGSGWTLMWGCAEEVRRLVNQLPCGKAAPARL